jgi:glycyl-tRNA synthetase beta chain
MKEHLSSELKSHRIQFDTIVTMGTPRRLAVCVRGLVTRQSDTVLEAMGPPEKVAFDKDGKPTKAATSFSLRQGVSVDDLEIVETKKGRYLKVEKKIEGKKTALVLPEVVTKVINAVPFPKSMRWADFDLRFARPVKWIVALFNGSVIPLSLENLESSNQSWGHRFLSNKPFVVQDFESYVQRAQEHHVIPDMEKRKAIILEEAQELAAEVGGVVLEDEALLDEVANLVEFPVTLRGTFVQEFLDLPRDVLIASMREHQRYLAVVGAEGALLPYFIVVSNSRAHDANVIIKGNERVLAARLTDARFFFEEDRKASLAGRVDDLKQVVHQVKLGSVYEKVTRVRELVRDLADQVAPELKEKADRCALLCKADLLTEMVGEFPSLQGTMGREYALREGEASEVAQGIYEHYLPTAGGGALPVSIVGSLLSIADKIDTITGCFGVGLIPTGTADPYALRRQALGIIRVVLDKGLRFNIPALIKRGTELLGRKATRHQQEIHDEVLGFIKGRFHHRLTASEYSYDVIDAVTSTRFGDLVDDLSRIEALQNMKAHPDFEPLASGFKRVVNIIASNPSRPVDAQLLAEEAEKELYAAYREAKTAISPLVSSGDYTAALNRLAMLKPAVDRFFDEVLVMCDDTQVKRNRLGLLGAVASLFLDIADFSKIVTSN